MEERQICEIATDYESPTVGQVCEYYDHVPPGEFAYHTAVCVGGFATATLYASDDLFGSSDPAPIVPSRCGMLFSGDNTVEYTFTIPCNLESHICEAPTYPCCIENTTMAVASETYEDEIWSTWLYGEKKSSAKFGYYLGGSEGSAGEMTKTFIIPGQSHYVRLNFTLLELESAAIVVRLQHTYFTLGFFDLSITDNFDGFFNDIYMKVSGLTPTTDFVSLIIPKGWYNVGNHLTISFVTNYGVGDLTIESICFEEEPTDYGTSSHCPT